jgi:hypothetical protein
LERTFGWDAKHDALDGARELVKRWRRRPKLRVISNDYRAFSGRPIAPK